MICLAIAVWSFQFELRPELSIYRKHIFLSDIAMPTTQRELKNNNLDHISIGPAPTPGNSRTITRSFVEGVLSRDGLDVQWGGAESCRVSRKAQSVPMDVLRGQVEDWLLEHSPQTGNFSLEDIKAALPSNLPAGDLSFDIFAGSRELKPGRNLLRIDTFVSGVRQRSFSATILLVLEVTAGRSLRYIERGETIQPDDLSWETIKIDRPTAPLISEDQVERVQARTGIPAGTILSQRNIEITPLVKRNDLVYVSAENGSLVIRMQAKSLDRGGFGQTVRLKNLDSGKIFLATVSGAGEARLNL